MIHFLTMPMVKFLWLLAIFGLTLSAQVSAKPRGRTGSGTGKITIINDENGSWARAVLPENAVEMTRKQLLRGQYSYTLGERMTGDKLLNQQEDSDDFPAARDVEASISYPSSGGGGLTLTYINILVEQSSEDGAAYVINGGINQKFATIVIHAKSTTHYAHSGAFYGY